MTTHPSALTQHTARKRNALFPDLPTVITGNIAQLNNSRRKPSENAKNTTTSDPTTTTTATTTTTTTEEVDDFGGDFFEDDDSFFDSGGGGDDPFGIDDYGDVEEEEEDKSALEASLDRGEYFSADYYPDPYCGIVEDMDTACFAQSILELWANDGR